MNFNKGDDVTINAKVIDVTASGNPVIQTKSGVKMLVKASDINTIRPYQEPGKEDHRKGE